MLKLIAVFIASIIFGAMSWAICSLIFNIFEPFDTGPGFLIGQVLMIIFLSYVGWSSNVKTVLLAILGIYIGQNLFAFILGGSEARAWVFLLLLTSITLCVLPLIAGLTARGLKAYCKNKEY